MRVLIIPEDFRKDQYILKPIVEKMLTALGRSSSVVRVCQNPLLGGIGEALKSDRLREIVDMYPQVQLFLLVVDRDGNANRRNRLDQIEMEMQGLLTSGQHFFAENAWQEIEVWALAGVASPPREWRWGDIRKEANPKERYFEPHARSRQLLNEPGQGRTTLGREAAANYAKVRSRCREDVAALERRLKAALSADA